MNAVESDGNKGPHHALLICCVLSMNGAIVEWELDLQVVSVD
jgi:hypothetical protein